MAKLPTQQADDELPPHRAARETTPPPSEADDDRIQFVSWDAPLVPR
jgi:hypothetical protein